MVVDSSVLVAILLGELLDAAEVQVEPADAELAQTAFDAWQRFGKGRCSAGLNFGDCFAYTLNCVRWGVAFSPGGHRPMCGREAALVHRVEIDAPGWRLIYSAWYHWIYHPFTHSRCYRWTSSPCASDAGGGIPQRAAGRPGLHTGGVERALEFSAEAPSRLAWPEGFDFIASDFLDRPSQLAS